MVPAQLRYRMCLVWVIYNAASLQLFVACRLSVGILAESSNTHSESGNLLFQMQLQPETSIMQPGSPHWKMNFLCHTLRRCLLELSPQNGDMETSIPPMTLPILPTDPEQLAPPPPTNPSTLSPLPSGTSKSRPPPGGDGGSAAAAAAMLSKGSSKALGITTGVGVTGILLLLVVLLYYFKPDIFMCCKTCVRVQVFHHNHPTK